MIVLSADGWVDTNASAIVGQGCCPPSLCQIDLCGLACSFIDLLPNGPMWNYWKAKLRAAYQAQSNAGCDEIAPPDVDCPTLIQHAVYKAAYLQYVLYHGLWPSLREASPETAETTVTDWLERYQWVDCFRDPCRSALLGDKTPYEIDGPCGPVYCDPQLSDALQCAVNRGILLSLVRVEMGIIKNLAGINWVIEPLAARIQPAEPLNENACDPTNCHTGDVGFVITNVGTTIPGCIVSPTPCISPARPNITAFGVADLPCGATLLNRPFIVYPGVIAAECIVRSLMPTSCKTNITRLCTFDIFPEPTGYELLSDNSLPDGKLLLSGETGAIQIRE